MAGQTNGSWSRIGDNALGFGLKRYAADEHNVLWRLQITRQPNDKVVELDANVKDLREIARWCEKAIEMVTSDGGRIPQDRPVCQGE
jgi:hypothetical protein